VKGARPPRAKACVKQCRAGITSPEMPASRLSELDNLFGPVSINNLNGRQSSGAVLEINLARLTNHVIKPLERDLDKVVIRIVSNAVQGQPLRLDLIAKG
jgi:hypothetical protein